MFVRDYWNYLFGYSLSSPSVSDTKNDDQKETLLPSLESDPKNPTYQEILLITLENAHKFDILFDYYQMRDKKNNGWDIFYYGHFNRDSITKNIRAERVLNNWQVGDRIIFNEQDTQKVIDIIKQAKYPVPLMVVRI